MKVNNLLFYIQRSLNKNIVIYSYNMNSNNEIDITNPISVYWIMKEKGPNITESLSYIEQKLAYGYTILTRNKQRIDFYIHSVPDMILTIKPHYNNNIITKYTCVNSHQESITKIYVKTKTGWIKPNVEYIDLFVKPNDNVSTLKRIRIKK